MLEAIIFQDPINQKQNTLIHTMKVADDYRAFASKLNRFNKNN